MNKPDKYTHYALSKINNKIVNGWDYSGYDPSELKQFKKDYFIADLIDYEINPKDVVILSRNTLIKRGINPDDWSSWSNNVSESKTRISENELTNYIRESIKRTLVSELHWKTWDSASKKSKGARSRAFAAKRDAEFNSQFGHNVDKHEDFEEGDGFVKMEDGRYRGGEVGDRRSGKHQTFGRPIDSDGHYGHFEQNGSSMSSMEKQPKFYSKKIARKFANGANEVGKMRNATYVKGQGWQADPNYQDIDWHEFWTDDDWKTIGESEERQNASNPNPQPKKPNRCKGGDFANSDFFKQMEELLKSTNKKP